MERKIEIFKSETEFKAIGHIDALEFQQAVKEQYDADINIGDVKHGFEHMRCYRKGKRHETIWKRCSVTDFGAKEITFCERIK